MLRLEKKRRMTPEQVTARQLTAAWGLCRLGLGAAALSAPQLGTRIWVGPVAPAAAAGVLGRALGGRDLGLGAGTVLSAVTGRPIRSWILASGAADAVDTMATALGRSGRCRNRALVIAASGGSVALAGLLALLADR